MAKATTAILLAAGEGKRMVSKKQKRRDIGRILMGFHAGLGNAQRSAAYHGEPHSGAGL